MAFHDVIYPIEVQSLSATPVWPIDVIKMGGGAEQRILLQGDSRREYEGAHSTLTMPQAQSIVEFFNGRRAQLYSFKIKDKTLYKATAEALGTGAGIGSTNQLIYNEGDATNAYNREVFLPKSGTIEIRANAALKTEGVDYTLAYNGATGGLVTWLTSVSGLTLTWSGEFYIPVRFDAKSLPDITLFFLAENDRAAFKGPVVPMVEIDYPSEWT